MAPDHRTRRGIAYASVASYQGGMLFLLLACAGTDGAADTGVADSGGADSGDTDTTMPSDLTGVPPEEPVALPTFAARNQHGEARSEADLLGHPSVLWFYPAAGTYG